MAQLLLELLSEEIPAGMQGPAAEQLGAELASRLAAEGYAGFEIRTFATPRRLAATVDGLDKRQPDVREERKGPRVDAPEKALSGFLASVQMTKDELRIDEDKKGAFYVAVIERKGRPTAAVVAELVPALVRGFKWPKSMRWGEGSLRWVRPLHSILCLFDGKTVPFEIDGLTSGNTTQGHRFLAPKQFTVKDFADYEEKLSHARVVLEEPQRRWLIEKGARELAESQGCELIEDETLLAENAGLVEWPVVLIGRIDYAFVQPLDRGGLPTEVLTSAMRKHQRYFALREAHSDTLAPRFIVVANLDAKDEGREIVAGNERVLRARLSDAKFFWDQDRKVPLASRVAKLGDIVFHAKLGTMKQKVARVAALAEKLAPFVGADPGEAKRAAHLAKADLTTQIVGEFPDLQGVMGRYYALNDGESAVIADAISEHYKPISSGDQVPAKPASIAVALADKLDTLVAFFAIDERPTGSGDPYSLRRAALGVVKIWLQNNLSLGMRQGEFDDFVERFLWPQWHAVVANYRGDDPELIAARKRMERSGDEIEEERRRALELAKQIRMQTGQGSWVLLPPPDRIPGWKRSWLCAADVHSFLLDRLKVHLRDRGIKHDLIDAVFALPGQDDLALIVARVNALKDFLASDDGANLLTAYKRAANIIRIEEKRDKTVYRGAADPALFAQKEERALHDAIARDIPEAVKMADGEDFVGSMAALARLRAPVDAFFDHVTVNTDDPTLRRNRLLMLSEIRAALESVADFSKIEG